MKKNKGRISAGQKAREMKFVERLDSLFDIADVDAMRLMKIQQDRNFLEDQRNLRKMIITSQDNEFIEKQDRVCKRLALEEQRRLKATESEMLHSNNKTCNSTDINTDNHVLEDEDEKSDEDDVYKPSSSIKLKLNESLSDQPSKPKKKIVTSCVASALDRNKISDRQSVKLIVPIVAALEHNPALMSISRSTIRRHRKEARKQCADNIKNLFSMKELPVIVHWDGKILPDILGNEKVDRLPILVSADGNNKLLGVPKLSSGIGKKAADAVIHEIKRWNILDEIEGMCFDTTSVNTGKFNGACTLIEKYIGRDMLWLACRHHVLEIVLSKVFTLCFGPSSSPEIPIFKRFKAAWNNITYDNYRGLECCNDIQFFKDSAVNSLQSALSKNELPRDDYMEFIELALLVLGHNLPKIHWRAPGPIHHARWMAKLIYAFKMYLFRDQNVIQMTQRQKVQLERFVKFGALLYAKNWIEALVAANAPISDLTFWQDSTKYQSIDKEISQTIHKTLTNHLWYLSDELVGLSLFSDKVTAAEKLKIVDKMLTSSYPVVRMVRGNLDVIKNESAIH